MTRTELIKYLRSLDACEEAIVWIEKTLGEPKDLWTICQHGDWMIWLLMTVNYDEKTLRHIACDCAESALPIYEWAHPTDHRPRDCIAVARRYAGGEATDNELLATWREAEKAARATSDTAVDAAAKSVVWAVFGDATKAASWAAISNAARAECIATSAAAWDAAMARHADIVRARVSWADVERALEHVTREDVPSILSERALRYEETLTRIGRRSCHFDPVVCPERVPNEQGYWCAPCIARAAISPPVGADGHASLVRQSRILKEQT